MKIRVLRCRILTPASPPLRAKRHGHARLTEKILLVALVALGFSLAPQLFGTGHATAQVDEQCLAALPEPTPKGDNCEAQSCRVVQLVNCSRSATLLGAANAAHRVNAPPTSVLPREKTWVMEPFGSPDRDSKSCVIRLDGSHDDGQKTTPCKSNVLTIDIPVEWNSTGSTDPKRHAGGAIFWARTGCRYDVALDRAQCESGGSGGAYDISARRVGGLPLGPPGGATITEWNFGQTMDKHPGPGKYFQDNFDISAVNGVNLTVDIRAPRSSAVSPGGPAIFWLRRQEDNKNVNLPMSVHGADLRADCPRAFTLMRSDLTGIPQAPFNQRNFASVIIGDNGLPLGGDSPVVCFNNCGKYKFPTEPKGDCDLKDPRCLGWNVFCAGDGLRYVDKANCPTFPNDCPPIKCTDDADCQLKTEVHAACWNQHATGGVDHTCQLRGFLSGSNKTHCDPNGENCTSECPADVCTYQYGFDNPFTHQPDYSTQPPLGACSDVFPNDDPNNPQQCIGEDRIHKVFPHAYTWPNDPQVYASDSNLYRVLFAPGDTKVPITPAQDFLPVCVDLPQIYRYSKDLQGNFTETLQNCSINVGNGAQLAIAHPAGSPDRTWACDLPKDGAGDEGVICRWNATLTNPRAVFAGRPNQTNCVKDSEDYLIFKYGSLNNAATNYGKFGDVMNLQQIIKTWCGQG
jgi:hypothetical protein